MLATRSGQCHFAEEMGVLTIRGKLRNAGNGCSPSTNPQKGDNHLGQNAAVHSEEEGPFRMLRDIARSNLSEVLVCALSLIAFCSIKIRRGMDILTK